MKRSITRKGFLSCDHFDRKVFSKPPIDYAPIYSWMWDDVISEEKTDRRLEEMQRLGIKRFYILPIPPEFRGSSLPSSMSPEYLSERFFAQCRYAIKRAAALNMQVWLYDEGGWPSGGACGRVLAKSDDYAQETVEIRTYCLHADQVYSPHNDVVASFLQGKRIYPQYTAQEDVLIDEYWKKRTVFQGTSEVSDVTKTEATGTFIRLTHEGYKRVLGDEFGETVTAVFTDEPTGPRPFPYREELSCKFYDLYSVHIEDYFPYLFGRVAITSDVADVIINWYDFCSKLFCQNYLEKEKNFCNSCDLVFLGHMDKDDEPDGSIRGGSYHILRALRLLDVPGVDVIHRQIYPNKEKVESSQSLRADRRFIVEKANREFPRYASSAAAQIGSRHALTESFAVYGNGLTFTEMRYVLNYQAIRGINVFNLMALSFGEKGALRAGILPHFTEKYACFADLKVFNLYCERLSYLASIGRRSPDVALYYPIRDSYVRDSYTSVADHFESVAAELSSLHVDYDVFDDDVLAAASDEFLDKGIVRVGLAQYRTLVFPFCRYVAPASFAKLSRFISGGGTVLTVLSEEGKAIIDGSNEVSISALGSFVLPAVDFIGGSVGFSAARQETKDGEMIFVMNENTVRSSCTVRLPATCKYLIRDIATAEIESIPNVADTISLELDSGEMVCLLCTEKDIQSSAFGKPMEVGEITDWTLRCERKMTLDKVRGSTISTSEEEHPVLLGDWRKYVGEEYSGTCVYRSCFAWDHPGDCIIDLGDVKYSCRITVNGNAFEPRVMSPYRWFIPKCFLKEKNEITVRVTNSSANAFLFSNAFDDGIVSSYYSIEKDYLAESLAGGLFGKVKLFTK